MAARKTIAVSVAPEQDAVPRAGLKAGRRGPVAGASASHA